MRLYLFRHGIAQDREDPDCPPEAERALTPRGARRTRSAARGLRLLGVRPEIVFTSPYRRAVETADIALKTLRLDPSSLVTTEALLPEANPAEFLAEIAQLGEQDAMCCGHRPHLDLVLARAVGSPSGLTVLSKAGAACVEFEDETTEKGRLVWLLTARSLRQLGRLDGR